MTSLACKSKSMLAPRSQADRDAAFLACPPATNSSADGAGTQVHGPDSEGGQPMQASGRTTLEVKLCSPHVRAGTYPGIKCTRHCVPAYIQTNMHSTGHHASCALATSRRVCLVSCACPPS